jgi:hypothetical protein
VELPLALWIDYEGITNHLWVFNNKKMLKTLDELKRLTALGLILMGR